MAWNKAHKGQTKDKILQSAAMLFTQYGFEKISIDQVMVDAQLTRGAFYSHFSSKSDLYAQAITKASKLARQRITSNDPDNMECFARNYLSRQHKDDDQQQGCPLAFLVSDINQQNEQVRQTYAQTFNRFVEHAEQLSASREKALQNTVLMIGGIALAKALTDQPLADELLQACKNAIAD